MTRGNNPGWRPSLRGLQVRIATAVLLAVLIPGVVVSLISFHQLSHNARTHFRQQALDQATSDLLVAADGINQVTSADVNHQLSQDPRLAIQQMTAFLCAPAEAFNPVVNTMLIPPNNKYAAVVLTANDHGGYTFTRPGERATDTYHRDVPDAVVDATDFGRFNSDVLISSFQQRITTGGKTWFAVGGRAGWGQVPGHAPQPIIAVEYHDEASLNAQISDYRTTLLLLTLAGAALATLIAWLVAGRIARPLRNAGETARAFGSGDHRVRLPVHGHDELAQLSEQFNAMADNLADTIRDLETTATQQRRFVADVAHELRTPVTTLLAAATALDNPATQAQAATFVAPQLRRLATLNEDLIEMSLMDSGAVTIGHDSVDLAALTADVIAGTSDPDAFSTNVVGDPTVIGDSRRLHSIVANLASNALTHGTGPVRITILGESETVTLSVADSGPGIDADLLPQIFHRFVRADRARSQTLGSGLGLSIALENARLHGGSLIARSSTLGAVLSLTLPRKDQRQSPAPERDGVGRAAP